MSEKTSEKSREQDGRPERPVGGRRYTDRQLIGRVGEDAVARDYAQDGYTVVERNRHESHNELDLIVQNEESLVFVEVKTRCQAYASQSPYGRPARAVDAGKKARTVAAAQAYLRAHPTTRQPRIDVAEVYVRRLPEGGYDVEKVVRFRNAFGAR